MGKNIGYERKKGEIVRGVFLNTLISSMAPRNCAYMIRVYFLYLHFKRDNKRAFKTKYPSFREWFDLRRKLGTLPRA